LAQVKKLRPDEPSKFTEKNLFAIAKDLETGRMPLPSGRIQVSDDRVTGLRAMVFKSGMVTFHIAYFVSGKDERQYMKIGQLNKESEDYISLVDARELTKTIKSLGDKGIDVQDGLLKRLVKELLEKGTSWRAK
jgi:hypothetical protein